MGANRLNGGRGEGHDRLSGTYSRSRDGRKRHCEIGEKKDLADVFSAALDPLMDQEKLSC